jgi:hypothetical protein
MADKITAWSFSRWMKYSNCPRAAKYAYIDKLPEPSSPALERGTILHKSCEDFLRGIKKTVPADIKLIAPQLKALKKVGALPEAEFAFNVNWQPVSWFAKDAWCRVKADALTAPILDDDEPTVSVDDFKSGGKLNAAGTVDVKGEYPIQLELYSLAGLLSYPTAVKAKSSLIFIDHGQVVANDNVFTQKDTKTLKKAWETRVKKMTNDTLFKPTPGNACRWCAFRKSAGGQCEY